MKNFLFTLFLTLSVFLISLHPVIAREIGINDISPKIKKYVIDHYKGLYKGKIEVSIDRMPSVPFKIPDGKLEIQLNSNLGDVFVQRTIVRSNFYVNGKFVKSVGIPVSLALYENVFVASEPIHKGDAITPAKVYSENRDVSRIALTAAKTVTDLTNTLVLKDFKAGEILDHRFIKRSPIVMRNSLVSLVIKTSDVAVTIPGEAMENGSMGDMIRVKSKDYKKLYVGKVVEKNTILVNI